MAKVIKLLEKGSADTLVVTDRGNELIGAVNSLLNVTFIPANAATLTVGEDGGAVLTFNMDELGGGGDGGGLPTPPASGSYYLASIDGTVQWVAESSGTVSVVLAVLQGDGTLKARVVEVRGTDVGDYPVPE